MAKKPVTPLAYLDGYAFYIQGSQKLARTGPCWPHDYQPVENGRVELKFKSIILKKLSRHRKGQ